MASQGPNYPSAAGTDTSVGSVTWASTGNIYSSNDSRATVSYAGPGTSHFLKATGFGFSIPSGATIDGIEVVFEGYTSLFGGATGTLNVTKLVKGGSVVGTDQDSGQNIGTFGTDLNTTIGGPTNLWGTTWTDTEINASDFGVAISITTAGQKFGGGAFCDTIKVTVYYTTGGGGGSSTNALLYIGN